jgi:plasmid stabilization system protein ParE
MTRTLVVDDEAQEEAEGQVAYYAERAGTAVALAFVAELEAIYRGLAEAKLVGVNHPRVKVRLPLKRVFMDRFRSRSCSSLMVRWCASSPWRRCVAAPVTGARVFGSGDHRPGAVLRREKLDVLLKSCTR